MLTVVFSTFPNSQKPKTRKQAVLKTRRKHVEKDDLAAEKDDLAITIVHYRANTGPLEAIPSLKRPSNTSLDASKPLERVEKSLY